jgi:hypothetical protein
MKNLTKKTKVVLFSLLGVSLLSLTGVGIAGWVIAGITPATTGNINVNVGETTDKRIKVMATTVSDATLQFDAQNGDVTGPITADSGSAEDLTFAFNFTVSGISNMGGFTLEYATDAGLTNNGASVLHTVVSDNYIVSPIADTGTTAFTLPATVAENAAVTVTAIGSTTLTSKVMAYTAPSGSNTGTATISVDGAFVWGSAFDNKNPCLIASDADDAKINTFKTGLTALAALNAKSLYITITPTAKA